MPKAILEAEDLTYRMSDKSLIERISLQFLPGKLYGVLGANGSGKSTLLKTLTGIWKPTSGHVLWKNHPLHTLSRQQISQIITLVPQSATIPFEFTVEELVTMGRYPHGRIHDGHQDRALLDWALDTVDVAALRRCSVNALSQGERQRVYIARALITESPVLLLDEPTANLDLKHQLQIWALLQGLTLQGKLIVVASHDLPACERICHHVMLMHQGRCAAQGTPSECLTEQALREIFGVGKDEARAYPSFKLVDRIGAEARSPQHRLSD